MSRYVGVLLCVTFLIAGCNGEPEPLTPEAKAKIEARKAAQKARTEKKVEKTETAGQAKQTEQAGGNRERQEAHVEKAHTGVGAKGHDYGGGAIMQPVAEPISVYFRSQEMMNYNIQIPHAMKIFKASNDRYPKDWNEFKSAILDPAHIKLPELPSGKEYFYDPRTGSLMVRTLK